MKVGFFQIILRLLCCALVLFPQYALAGIVNIPGFRGTVSPRVPAPAPTTVPQLLPGGVLQGATVDTSRVDSQNLLVINQNLGQQNAIIDWRSFNIGSNATVRFYQGTGTPETASWQPNSSYAALNRIWDANPSQIFGNLKADGKIFLINQNGILFSPTSRVNVNSLVASALNIHDADFLNNLLHFRLENYQALSSLDPLAAVSNQGEINAADGGYVFLLAPRVVNDGAINAPTGQIGLIAGTDVLLKVPAQDDLSRAGYYVYVNDNFSAPLSADPDFGRAVNSGQLYADGGMAGMYGNNVDQWGVIRAVTAFKNKQGQVELKAANKITTGAQSTIDLHVFDLPDPATGQLGTVNGTFVIQPKVAIVANQVELGGAIVAPAGLVTVNAQQGVVLDAGSSVTVKGAEATLPLPLIAGISLNSVELRDAYAQKDGVLQGQKITTSVTSGSTIGDLSQALLTTDRTAQERLVGGAMTRNADGSYSTQSGNITIAASNGDIIVKPGAVLDISGGAIHYAGGAVNSTKLLSGTKIYDIGNAPLNIQYDNILGNYTKTYDRFGIRKTYTGLYYGGASPIMSQEKGYTQGGDAGSLTLSARRVVLDGELNGGVTSGQYQNTWTTQASDDALALSKARGLEAPRAGTLNITATSISMLAETSQPVQAAADPSLTLISAKTLNNAHLSSVSLNAGLAVSTAADAAVTLQPGGSFSATAGQIDHNGQITALGGSISLAATGAAPANGETITLGSGSRLDVSGERIDNSRAGAGLQYGPIAGGSVSILDTTDNGTGAFIKQGAVVDVSGGYSIDPKGKVAGGNAGQLSIQGKNIQLDGDLRGYALADPSGKILGGAITLTSTEIHVGDVVNPQPGWFVLAGNRLDETGFSRITLQSRNDLVVGPNTTIGPSLVRLNNPVLQGRPDLITLDDATGYMAGPSSFSANAGINFAGSVPNVGYTGNLRFYEPGESTAMLVISPGAVVRTTAAASSKIALTGSGAPSNNKPGVIVEGKLESPGGTVSVETKYSDLLIGDHAEILATGFNRPDPSSTPKGLDLNYQPVNGGNVTLTAAGNLTLAASARIDVSGSDAVTNAALANGTVTTYQDAGSPGSVSLTYDNANKGGGLIWQGAVTANQARLAGLGGISGGSLKIGDMSTTSGMAVSNADLVKYLAMNFDDLTFTSRNSLGFSDPIDIQIGRKLTLDAPVLKSGGAGVSLSAPWIVLTNTSAQAPLQPTVSTTSGPAISLGKSGQCQWIDVIGSMNFTGFGDVTLQAARDIRLSQALYSDRIVRNGQLAATGNLTLDAERIYPGNYYKAASSTLYPDLFSDYTVHAAGKVTLQHTVGANNPAADRPLYSAGGSLIIEGLGGIDVESGVKVAAPLGQITLTAPGKRIYLADGSVLTTAGNTAVAYGLIDSGNIWVTQNKSNPVSGAVPADANLFTGDGLPAKGVILSADEVIAREGSVVDVSGGGSIFGYRFQPGVTGSVDPLAKPGRYIAFKDNSFPMPGTAVYLQAGGGLTAGTYTLLPLDANNPQNARYAFLPGAYILEKQSAAALPGTSSLSKDGYPLIVGYSAVADTTIRSQRAQVYSIRSANDVLALEGNYAMQSVTSGNGGNLSITGNTIVLNGSFNGAALTGSAYHGGKISLGGLNIFVRSSSASLLPADFKFGDALDATLQGKLYMSGDTVKGFREADLGDTNGTSATNSITVEAGAELKADVISLGAAGAGANSSITLAAATANEAGAKLTATSGDGLITLATPGNLDIQGGSTINASHGITLDANNLQGLQGDLLVDNSALTLKSSEIFFGSSDHGALNGLYLTQTKWNTFASVEDITLISGSDIQFNDVPIDLSAARSLTLDAQRIAGNGHDVTVTAPTVNLRNSGAASTKTAPANMGTFTVAGRDKINIGSGDVLFGGFKNIALDSTNDLTFRGKGSLTTGNADLSISAARVTTATTSGTAANSYNTTSTAVTAPHFAVYTGANYSNDQNNPAPAGTITITNSGATPVTAPAAGGTLDFQGRSIYQGGVIQVDGGTVKLSAMGPGSADGVTLRSGSRVLARGTADAPGGQVLVQSSNGGIVMEAATGALPASSIDVSAGGRGDAGLISLRAPTGGVTLNGIIMGAAQGSGKGGSFALDTNSIGDITALNDKLKTKTDSLGNVISGGFTESLDLRARTGNIDIASGQTVQARHVKLTADDQSIGNGQINVTGQIIGTEGGSVELYAMNDLTVQSGGKVTAANSAGGSSGGNILLSSEQGSVNVKTGGAVDVSGGANGTGGTIYLRAQRNGNGMNITLAPGSLTGATAVYAEAFKRYDYNTSSLATSGYAATWLSEAASYYASNTALAKVQAAAPGSASFVLPGIEVVNTGGDITVNTPTDLSAMGADTNPGVLTVRAAGNLNINGNLTDTPAYAASGYNPITNDPPARSSWAFNLAAGADASSADPLAVNRTGAGDLNIKDQVVVYTESAPIRFASAGDTKIGMSPVPGYMVANSAMGYNLASFSGSVSGNVGRDLTVAGAIQTAKGDINISVGRDLSLLVGSDSTSGVGAIRTTGQLSNSVSLPDVIDQATGLPIAVQQADTMGTDYWKYRNGGNITLSVGRNVGKELSPGQWAVADTGAWDYFSQIDVEQSGVSLGSYGLFSANYVAGTAGLATMGGGDLFVRTGGDFLAQAGTFGPGNLEIYSNGDVKGRFLNSGAQGAPGRGEISAAGNFGSVDHRTQLELGNSRMDVTARGELQIGAVLNPTLASDTVLADGNTGLPRDAAFVHCTYTPDTSISLTAGTDVTLAGVSPYYQHPTKMLYPYESILPATASITAATGDVFLLNNFVMASSPRGNLIINAGGNLKGYYLDPGNHVQPASILMSDISTQNWYGLFSTIASPDQKTGWVNTRTSLDTIHHGLYDPANNAWALMAPLHTQDTQAILVHAGGDISDIKFVFPKQSEVTAGRDIRDIIYEGQNITAGDVSLIRADNDIIMKYVKAPVATGYAPPTDTGPHNGLIQGGPGVFMVQAGGSIDLGSLQDGIQAVGNGNNANLDAAKSKLVILSGYGFDKSAADITGFFDAIRSAGDGYAKLMAAGQPADAAQLLQTTRQDTIDPLMGAPTGAGDINMTSSQIATSVGQSDIFVIANGDLNLGQTALPLAGTNNKTTGITTGGGGAINIFARKDVNVNESRVMTFYGGDITVWSDQGSINAGRGSRTAVSASPPKPVIKNGVITLVFSPPAVGSGIRAVTYGDDPPTPGDIHLFAPSGLIDAGEAGIAGGQVTLAALKVANAANISFSSGSLGVPQQSAGAANIGSLSGSGSAAQNSQLTSGVSGLDTTRSQASQIVDDIIAKWLDVKVVDFVEDGNNDENK